jgi:hypothetical protein
VLIGQRKKQHILKGLVPSAKKERVTNKKQKRPIQLHLDLNTILYKRPLLYANCPLSIYVFNTTAYKRGDCPDLVLHLLQHTKVSTFTMAKYINARLLRLFADVFCLFYKDFHGFNPITNLLQSWIEKGQSAMVPVRPKPSLMLVIKNNALGTRVKTKVKAELLRRVGQYSTRSIFNHFSNVKVVALFPEG